MSSVTFVPEENVLCYHGPLIYEAKVIKTAVWDEMSTKSGYTGPHYFVHYKGWKHSWDEWVHPQRLLKLNDVNLQKQADLKSQMNPPAGSSGATGAAAAKKEKEKEKSSSTRRKDGAGGGAGGRKRGREEDAEDASNKKPALKFDVPEPLKVLLVDDWERITKKQQLVNLPRTPSVQDILQEFAAHCQKSDRKLPHKDLVLQTLIAGLQLYFERSIGSNLLYRMERAHYATARRNWITGQHVDVATTKSMSEVYGAEHLLRLIVKMPEMIAQTTLDPESVALLKEYMTELLAYMTTHKERLFPKDYENASGAYLTLMRAV